MTKSYTEVNTKLEARSEVVGRRSRSKPGDFSLRSEHAPQSGSLTVPIEPKLSGFFTLHKGGGEAEKPFRAIPFGWLKQPWGLFNHHLFGELLRSIAQSFNVSHSKRV